MNFCGQKTWFLEIITNSNKSQLSLQLINIIIMSIWIYKTKITIGLLLLDKYNPYTNMLA